MWTGPLRPRWHLRKLHFYGYLDIIADQSLCVLCPSPRIDRFANFVFPYGVIQIILQLHIRSSQMVALGISLVLFGHFYESATFASPLSRCPSHSEVPFDEQVDRLASTFHGLSGTLQQLFLDERPTNPGVPAIEDVRRIFAPQTNDDRNFLTT